MSWVDSLAGVLGVPGTVASLAIGIYGACVAAEKSEATRPAALHEIAVVLSNRAWTQTLRPSAIIGRVFRSTFGERQWSLSCAARSALATLCITTTLAFALGAYHTFLSQSASPEWQQAVQYFVNARWFVLIALFSLAPDYAALWKTRVLIGGLDRVGNTLLTTVGFVAFDIMLSLMISLFWIFGVLLLFDRREFSDYGIRGLLLFTPLPILPISTLFTSIWSVLILVSISIVKLMAPLQRATVWFFDVERHPLQAIGVVAAALIMLGGLTWAVVSGLA